MRIKSRRTRLFTACCTVVWAATCLGQEPKQEGESKVVKQRRLSVMQKRIESLGAIGPTAENCDFSKDTEEYQRRTYDLELLPQPIL
jgi:hypothetical protein